MDDAYDWCPPQDDRQAADQLSAERYESTLAALYHAAMLGLPEDDLRVLCAETGVAYKDLEGYQPPILRPQPAQDETAPLPF